LKRKGTREVSDYTVSELEQWNERIEEKARNLGLRFYDQEFEIVSFEDMIGFEAYAGMPSRYPHWSFGKAFERIRTLYRYNLTGLPYEMVINSDPCIAYLMKDNTLLLQILTMTHVYGHNDFFRNNRMFRQGTDAGHTIEMFKSHADRIRRYISDPSIGYKKIEKILNSAHALRFQTSRVAGEKRLTDEQKINRLLAKSQKPPSEHPLLEPAKNDEKPLPNFKKIPLEPETDLLLFVSTYGRLSEWEKDILSIVREETSYFIPQIETKIMNEGWASYWHYRILKEFGLPQGLYLEFIKRHNQVIKPLEGHINPYYLGFKLFEEINGKHESNRDKIFEVREIERDESFIRRYLTKELCQEMNLFEYVKRGNDYVISEVSDEEGWKKIRDHIAASAGMGGIPVIRAVEWVARENTLMLEHVYDGRELDLGYAYETLKHMIDLWDSKITLTTTVDGRKKILVCDELKRVSIING